jgi:hypothetical protein
VPSAALRRLPAGDGYYSVTSRNRRTVAAGDWSLLLRAESTAVLGDDTPVYGGTTLQ